MPNRTIFEFSNDDGDANLDRLNTTGDVVIATISDASHRPVIMTQDESLASGIYLQWMAAVDARVSANN